jgi:hypothetical protein
MIDRTGAAALIPEEVASDIVKAVQYESVSMKRFRTVRMGRKQQRMPVLSVLPQASWVNGDTGLKSVTDASGPTSTSMQSRSPASSRFRKTSSMTLISISGLRSNRWPSRRSLARSIPRRSSTTFLAHPHGQRRSSLGAPQLAIP